MENAVRQHPIAFMWDYEGAYDPNSKKIVPFQSETFSVGIFQWVPRVSKKGLKKSAVVKRIRGRADKPENVYKRAQEECDKRNLTVATTLSGGLARTLRKDFCKEIDLNFDLFKQSTGYIPQYAAWLEKKYEALEKEYDEYVNNNPIL
jgi:hypothetical protein